MRTHTHARTHAHAHAHTHTHTHTYAWCLLQPYKQSTSEEQTTLLAWGDIKAYDWTQGTLHIILNAPSPKVRMAFTKVRKLFGHTHTHAHTHTRTHAHTHTHTHTILLLHQEKRGAPACERWGEGKTSWAIRKKALLLLVPTDKRQIDMQIQILHPTCFSLHTFRE